METNVSRPEATKSKTASKPVGKDNLQTLLFGGGGEETGFVAGRPHPGRGAKAADPIWAQRDRGEEDQRGPEVPLLFLGSDPLDDRSGGDPVGGGAALAGLCIILLLLLANAVVGFWEEHQAGNAIDALKTRLAIKARVKRDGKWINPAARELVPGDVIRLRLGDIVPADARLLEGDEMAVDQSALTGESLPATRKSGDAVFSGSIIRRGEIDALVFATGGKTYFGKTAELVETAVTISHFQKAVLKIGNSPDHPRAHPRGDDHWT